MREDLNKLVVRVDDIEKEPAEEYKDIKKNIRNAIISFIVGAILSALAVYIFK